MLMLAPIDLFAVPYEVREMLPASEEELRRTGRRNPYVATRLLNRITNALEAAVFIARQGTDPGLRRHVNDVLDESETFAAWRRAMPSSTPAIFTEYRDAHAACDFDAASAVIKAIGAKLSPGQWLFHGGRWPFPHVMTDRPLSTSLCPEVALNNAAFGGRAFEAGSIDLLALEVREPTTAAFVFGREGSSLHHENEVLFAAGAAITIASSRVATFKHVVGARAGRDRKTIPVTVHHAIIS